MGSQFVPLSSAPLFKRLTGRGAPARFAKKIGESPQTIANWKKRGTLPDSQLRKVCDALDMSLDLYVLEANEDSPSAGEPPGLYAVPGGQLLQDFRALPPWLQEHIARKTQELRRYADSLPAIVRDGMRGPPSDPEHYRAWEAAIEADMALRRANNHRKKTEGGA